MIKQWNIKNFKSAGPDFGDLELAPITLLAGANSSGKSTLIQSVLLLMQTIGQGDSASLVLNGDLIKLGTVTDLWHKGIIDNGELLTYAFCISKGRSNGVEIWLVLSFEAISSTKTRLIKAQYEIRFSENDEFLSLGIDIANGPKVDWLSERLHDELCIALNAAGYEDAGDFSGQWVEQAGLFPHKLQFHAKRQSQVLNWGTVLRDPFQKSLTDKDLATSVKQHQQLILDIAQRLNLTTLYHFDQHNRPVPEIATVGDLRVKLAAVPATTLDEWQDEMTKHFANEILEEGSYWWPCWEVPGFDVLIRETREFFSRQIRYLGANRVAPTIIFSPEISSHWSEVGIDGANVASALHEFGKTSIRWFDPTDFTRRETTLIEAVERWLQYFGMLDGVGTEDRGKLGTQLSIRSAGVNHDLDLTSVGFGVSQILPIIVQGLMTPRDGVFIVEQPEVHLHPAVQSKLAVFFLALTRGGVQCIIETHSENIVNQFRLFLSKKQLKLDNDIKIYFAEREADIGTRFFEVELDKKGNIKRWPAGFMDETTKQSEAMLRQLLIDDLDEE